MQIGRFQRMILVEPLELPLGKAKELNKEPEPTITPEPEHEPEKVPVPDK